MSPNRRRSSVTRPGVFIPPMASYFPGPAWRWNLGGVTEPLEPILDEEEAEAGEPLISPSNVDGTTDEDGRESTRAIQRKKLRDDMRKQSILRWGHWNSRPSLGQYIKCHWSDLLTLLLMAIASLVIHLAESPFERLFAVTDSNGSLVDPSIAWPRLQEKINPWQSALIAELVPMAILLMVQLRVRSFWDLNNALMGLQYAILTGCLFQVIVKWLIGGLRPNFLATCKPIMDQGHPLVGSGYHEIYYDSSVCSGNQDDIRDAFQSFPSGHSVASFAGFVFLSLYLNAKLKTLSNHRAPLWTLLAVSSPILVATIIAGLLTVDKFHHWYDVVAGGVIGTFFAFISFRMMYASVLDFRFNHLPLLPNHVFTYSTSDALLWSFRSTVVTRAAGWDSVGKDPAKLFGNPAEPSATAASPHANPSTAESSTHVGSTSQGDSTGQAIPTAEASAAAEETLR